MSKLKLVAVIQIIIIIFHKMMMITNLLIKYIWLQNVYNHKIKILMTEYIESQLKEQILSITQQLLNHNYGLETILLNLKK